MTHCLLRTRHTIFPKASPTFQFVRWKSGPGLLRAQSKEWVRPSAQVMSKNMLNHGDIGLLTDTFIMPTGKNLPGILAEPRARFKLMKQRIRQRILDLRDMFIFRTITKNKLRLREPKKVAPSLYKDMNTAFAEGDMDTLRLICGDGLLASFQKRIFARGGIKMEWKLHSMLSRPKLVSSKAHHYPGSVVNRRQAVIRIHSLQSLSRFTPKGELVKGSDQPKEVVEYVVIERNYDSGKESSWYVWGTTEETTLERLAEQKKRVNALMRHSLMS